MNNVFVRYHRWLLPLLLLLSAPAALADLRPFDRTSLDSIEAEHAGQEFLLVLWSQHCAPCFAELKLLGELLAEQPALPVVLVSTDAGAPASDLAMVLEDYALPTTASWQFADPMPERLRHAIDPDWFGELPRSYLYRADGSREAHSGMLTEAVLRALFER